MRRDFSLPSLHSMSMVVDVSRRVTRLKFLSFLFFFLSLFSVCQSNDLDILMKFKAAFQKSNTLVFDSWTTTSHPCNFTGVSCDSLNSVTGIELGHQNLSGVFPVDYLCQLQSLQKLSLGSNFVYGTITDGLKNCSSLQYLDLGFNSFSGTFPDFSALTQLELLSLNASGFSGPFPWSSLANMTNLAFLSLGDNVFDKAPFPVEVLKLEKLYWLYLSNCSLEGVIPVGIGNLTLLINLELADNNLTGEIPVDIGKLTNLWQLEVYDNHLTGKFPPGFGNLTSLNYFDASKNQLEGDLSELRFLTKLMSLQLYENQFTGGVPEEFGDFRNLVNLSLYTNQLTGPLPQKLGSWADFIFIDASDNYLTGSIPPDMCKNGKMNKLLLLQNKFTGEIPANYANCTSLIRFRVNNNSLSGTVPPGIWGLPNVHIIDLTMNRFEGSITSDIANAKSLAQLYLRTNRFSGELPPEITKASSLSSIDLSFNKFSGQILSSIGELMNLNNLYLQNNQFSGSIPASLTSCLYLNVINFAGNSLSGSIPSALGSFQSLNSLNLSDNELSGSIPSSLSSLKLSLLDLSNNQLSGSIPQSLSIEAYNGSFAGNPGLCSSNINSFQRCSSDSGSVAIRTVISCFVVGAAVLILSVGLYLFLKKRQKANQGRTMSRDSWDLKSFHVMSFSEHDILDSIKEENLIGKGGSGNVYRVVVGDGKELAVKHIWNNRPESKSSRSSAAMLKRRNGYEEELEAEVATLSSIRHVNVVKLYCSITSEDSSLLVYEYMPNGSLWDRLHTCEKMELDWVTRHEIAVGAAKGLEYLHHGCEKPVIHRDVKSSNILLDEFLKPRIADFGLAKIVRASGGSKDSSSTHVIAGTHGYIAPEYAYTCKVNEKSDVYSFGVVLMELVTGKRPTEPEFGENKDIVYWVNRMVGIRRESVIGIVDPRIPKELKEDAVKVLRIATMCTANLPTLRPSMRTVVQMLEDAEPCKLINISIIKDDGEEKLSRSKVKEERVLVEVEGEEKISCSP
ncbi:receptor-like protein kinase 7 [Macadamia integrifolia]|uniref:receptor-like protein kinase 7 n=1 Tax=Macadamia integrifolia TaxID=60698 RepID=UPI001C52B2F6|nr:receptor-like protein kinase 7 [Macadamia integrifolia]